MTGSNENVLVVLLEDGRAPELRRALARRGDDQSVHVVAPATIGRLQWLTSDEDAARDEARARAAGVVWALSDQGRVEIEQGDVDPVQAVEDALREFQADEIVLVGSEDDAALELALVEFGLPVRRAEGARPPEDGDDLRRQARRVADGRSPATPFAMLASVNVALLAMVVLVILIVFLVFWLV